MPARPRRRRIRRWPLVLGVCAVALLLLAVAGGLADAGPRLGPERTPGEGVAGHRWVIAVHDAAITQRSESAPVQVTLRMTVENLTDDYLGFLTQGLVVVVLPDGSEHAEAYVADPGNGFGNPGVVTPVEMRIDVPPPRPGDVLLTVLLRNEQEVGSFVTAERWTPTASLGHLRLTATDARDER